MQHTIDMTTKSPLTLILGFGAAAPSLAFWKISQAGSSSSES
jgi:hypothetical protein